MLLTFRRNIQKEEEEDKGWGFGLRITIFSHQMARRQKTDNCVHDISKRLILLYIHAALSWWWCKLWSLNALDNIAMHVHASARDIGIRLDRSVTTETMLKCWSNEAPLVVRRNVSLSYGGCLPNFMSHGSGRQSHQEHKQVLGYVICGLIINLNIYRVSQEERTKLREGVSYVKLYRYNPKHLYPKLNGYGDNGQRKLWTSCISA